MFQTDDYVMHESAGVCRIAGVESRDFMQSGQAKQYYSLKPLHSPCDSIFVPVEGDVRMRDILTRSEATELIDKIPNIEADILDDDSTREQICKDALQSFDCYEWVRIVKSLHLRISLRKQEGKKPLLTDEKYLMLAEDYLHGELSVALDIPLDEIGPYIARKVRESKIDW
ncbi:MAG: CarD family transcriptional regulator [Christensenella sp.]|uniref:CarD family transcriptional regulator n=1 Tax=Christensenella sp. TaxID=1935934 RepID=UPI002B1FEB96|nr:CarD family transcriptional regulator [Christensenella sp.]MEA5003776.1 CarD family transcriptional regulator [Christensenella sp.]